MNRFIAIIILLFLSMHPARVWAQHTDLATATEKARVFANKGNGDSAVLYAGEAIKLAIKYADRPGHIKSLGSRGKGYFHKKMYKEAAESYFKALRLCSSEEDDKQRAYLYSEIGYLYYHQGLFKESKEYYYKGLDIRRRLHDDKETADALINISGMSRDHKEFKEAFATIYEVKDMLPRIRDTATLGYYYNNMGVLMELNGKPDSAAWCYHMAYKLWKQVGKEAELFRTTYNIGYLAQERKDYAEAMKYFMLSLAAAKKYGLPREVAHVYGTIAEGYAAMRDYRQAYSYLYSYTNLSDSLSKDEFNSYVAKLDKQFQTEKNKETIQDQQLKLKTANLAIQEQRTTKLIIILILVVVVLAGIMLFGYLTFQKRLQKTLEEAKSRFFANVAHEIRTPLSMIQGPIKVLQGKVNDDSMQHQLAIAERNTNRLNDLISQMLDIAKLDAAAYRLNESVGSLQEYIDVLTMQYEQQAAEQQISFARHIEITTGSLLFDKDALEKVISNLLSNALKYTPAGGSAGIDVSTVATNGNIMLSITVWDTGAGMTRQDKERIFERFYRAAEQHNAGTKGIGIGLSLVKELVSLMKGTITVESEPGSGTAFTVQLVLQEARTAMAAAPAEGAQTILLVEDDKDILDFNKLLLAESGYHVLTATNGNEAATLLQDTLPDLVITDVMMPEKDGLTLLKEIRANEATSHLPVIMLSARASAQAKIEGVAQGAQVYLSKPFQPDELVALVRSQLMLLQTQKNSYQQQVKKEAQTIEERFSGNDPFTIKCYQVIAEHLDDPQLSVEKLAELMNINRSHFQRKIKALTGYSPSELIRTIRLEKARELLLDKKGNITEVAYATGFTSQSYFTKCFSEHFGFPPSQLPHQK